MKTLIKKIKTYKALKVLENVKVENNILTFTNLETSVKMKVENIESGLYYKDMYLDNLTVKNTNIDPSEYPTIEEMQNTETFFLTFGQIKLLQRAAKFTIKKDEFRPAMKGVFLGPDGLCATNAQHLFWVDMTFDIKRNIIIPVEFINVIALIKSGLTIAYNDKSIKAFNSDIEIQSYLINERFPDYKVVIPTNEGLISFNKKDLINTIKQVAKFSHKKTNRIELNFKDGNGYIFAENMEENILLKLEIKPTYNSNGFHSCFDHKFLLAILNNCEEENISIAFNPSNDTRAIIINDQFLLMPIKK